MKPFQLSNRSLIEQITLLALGLFIFSLPFEYSVQVDLGSVSKLVGLMAMFVGTLAILEKGATRPWLPFHFLFAGLIIWIMLGYQWSVAPATTFTRLFSMVQFWTLSFLIWQFANNSKTILTLMIFFVAGAFISNLLVLSEFLESGKVPERYTVANANFNGLAFLCAIAISMAWFLSLTIQERHVSTLFRAYLPVGFITIILTGSRGGFLATTPSFLFILTSFWRPSGTRILSLIVLIAITSIAVTYLIPPEQLDRVTNISNEIRSGDLAQRSIIWDKGIEVLNRVWFWGSGYDTFRTQGIGRPAHNTWLSLFVGLGLIGMLIFSAMLLNIAYSLRILPTLEWQLWAFILLSWMIFSLSSDLENLKITWVLFSLAITSSGNIAHQPTENNHCISPNRFELI